jgi:phosphoserine phosphatase RsbU/P
MSILIVDDTRDNILLLQAILKKEGYEDLKSCGSVKEVYELLGLDGGAQAHYPDLILMDFMMPDISGIEACRKLKALPIPEISDIPIIMITAKTDQESLQEAFDAGAMDYLTKPVRRTELLARIKSAIKLKMEMDCRKKRERELQEKNENLEKAMREIKTLRGFLPICSFCKKIRNVEGMWQQMEVYIQNHADVKFSHGLCEVCMKAQYPEFSKDKNSFS